MMTVGDILTLPSFSNCRVLSGLSGLKRVVNGWNVAERLDFHLWMKGGEFIVSMMSFAPDHNAEQEITSWVQSLIDSGASALGIKKSVYNGAIPQFLLEMGDWNSFPIIEMADDISLSTLGEEIVSCVIAGKADTLKKAIDLFSEITSATVAGWIPAFIRQLSIAFDNPVLLETPNMHLISAYDNLAVSESEILAARRDPNCVAEVVEKLSSQTNFETVPMWGLSFIEHVVSVQDREHRQVTFPVDVAGHLYGYISVIQSNRDFDADDLMLMRVAVNATALVALKDSTYELHDEISHELFNAIVDPARKDEAEERAWLYGFSYEIPSFCVIAQLIEQEFSGRCLNDTHISRLYKSLRSIDPGVLVVRHNSSIIIICHLWDDDTSRKRLSPKFSFQERCKYVMKCLEDPACSPYFRFGIGRPATGIVRIRLSFEEALSSIRIAERFSLPGKPAVEIGQNSLTRYYSLLDEIIQNDIRARAFCSDILGPFMKSKVKNKDDYYDTLETYLLYNQSYSEIYKNAGLHRNTARYRIEKIEQILNIDLNDMHTRLSVWIALQIRKHLKIPIGKEQSHGKPDDVFCDNIGMT